MEQQINELEIKKEELEKEMALPSVYNDFQKMKGFKQSYEAVNQSLTQANEIWEALVEKIG